MNWWVHSMIQNGQYTELISWIFWVIFSITLHELAHGWAAIWQGDRTPIELGHMNGNPLVHMGPHSLLIFALCGIAWGAMPVSPHRFRTRRWGDVYVSAAGPAMNLLIGFVCLIILTIWLKFGHPGSNFYRNLSIFLYYGIALNFILAPLNLLPIPPLDGSTILAGFSMKARELYRHPNAPMIGMGLFIVIFFLSPVGDIFFQLGWLGAVLAIDIPGSILGNPSILDLL